MNGFSGFGNSPLKQATKEEPRIDRWVRKSKEAYNKHLGVSQNHTLILLVKKL